MTRLDTSGDKTWLRSRTIVITFEECWPLAVSLSIQPELSTKRSALLRVAKATKQKDAAGLGALAYAYQEGDKSMLDAVPDRKTLRTVAEGLKRPSDFFRWLLGQGETEAATEIIQSAQRYLPAATWPWDKACIMAGALLATLGDVPTIPPADTPLGEFAYWIALDKHTPEGKAALAVVARQVHSTYRKLIWASFYCESAVVNRILPSPWWDAERTWRLRRAGLTSEAAEDLWSRARPLLKLRLEGEAASLRKVVESGALPNVTPAQQNLL